MVRRNEKNRRRCQPLPPLFDGQPVELGTGLGPLCSDSCNADCRVFCCVVMYVVRENECSSSSERAVVGKSRGSRRFVRFRRGFV